MYLSKECPQLCTEMYLSKECPQLSLPRVLARFLLPTVCRVLLFLGILTPASSHQRRKSSDFSSRNRSAVASRRDEEASECVDWKEERGVDVDFRVDRSIHRESSRIHSTYGRFIGESIESSSLFLLFMQDALCLPCVSLDSSRFAFLNNAAAR